MASELENRIIALFEQAKNEIVANIQSAKITASGRTEKSISVVVRSGHISLIKQAGDNAPISSLEIGREPGKVPANKAQGPWKWRGDK